MKSLLLNKHSLAIFSLSVASATFAAGRSEWSGTYEGTGYWKDSLGHSGTYKSQSVVASEPNRAAVTFKNTRKFPLPTGEQIESMDFTIVETSKDFFKIEKAPGEVVGQGYCVFSQCHYTYETPGAGSAAKVEESINFNQGKLYKLGSKVTFGGQTLTWAEFLDKKSSR